MMNNLVAYGSSSDSEDEDVPPQPPSLLLSGSEKLSRTKESPIREATSEKPGLHSATLSEAPMIGPTAPSNGYVSDTETELSPNEPQDLSERDTLRYLTQTTYPMTSIPP